MLKDVFVQACGRVCFLGWDLWLWAVDVCVEDWSWRGVDLFDMFGYFGNGQSCTCGSEGLCSGLVTASCLEGWEQGKGYELALESLELPDWAQLQHQGRPLTTFSRPHQAAPFSRIWIIN